MVSSGARAELKICNCQHVYAAGGASYCGPVPQSRRSYGPFNFRSRAEPRAWPLSALLRSRARGRASTPVAAWLVFTLCVLALQVAPSSRARAERTHTVKGGQSLTHIARLYGVTSWSLAAANSLPPEAPIREGQVLSVPDKGVVYVNAGQTLWSVARRHECTVEALADANGLSPSASLRPGMRLLLPGHKPSPGGTHEATAPRGASQRNTWGIPKRGGRVELFRVATGQNLSLSLVDKRGRVRPESTRQLARFLRPRNSTKTKKPNGRLLALLAQVSDHFGGRKIHIISGYRMAGGNTHHESRHVAAAAIDFRVEGVPNRTLRDYLRHFNDVGVGYYPNSTFIHFDVRPSNAYWVDLSSPGQRSAYVPREEREGFDGKTTGLAELGKSLEVTLDELDHGEPEAAQADDE
jgi:uncharacterized protein YcbK (DUF882 family)